MSSLIPPAKTPYKPPSTSSHVRQVLPGAPQSTENATMYHNNSFSDESGTSWSINSLGPGETPRTRVRIGETEQTMCADTGASTTIIDETHYLTLIPRPELRRSKAPVFGFSSKTPLEILGEFEATLVLGDKSAVSLVSVVKGNCGCLLCCEDCVRLEVVSLNESKLVRNVRSTTKYSADDTKYREEIFAKYPKVFSGRIGRLKGFKAKLSINPNVKNIDMFHTTSRNM